jgi:hypothetical protein
MANLYKVRLEGRGTTAAGSTLSPFLTGHLVAISWPGCTGSTQRHSTGQNITFSVSPHSSEQEFMLVTLGDKTTGKIWYPTIQYGTTVGTFRSTAIGAQHLPLCRQRIKMNWEASSHKSCGHLDIDLYIDGPPGLEGTS